MKKKLRLIGLAMLVIAVIFVCCALSNPALGHTIYIGPFTFGAEQWRTCYAIYAIIMILLFILSWFIKDEQ